MAIAKKCDICGVLYEQYNCDSSSTKVNGFQFLNILCDGKAYSNKFNDCCPKCMDSIKQHIKTLREKAK